MLPTIILFTVNNDPFQALDNFVSNTFSKELLALAFVMLLIVAVGSIAIKNSLLQAAAVAIVTLAIIHLEVGIDQPMQMPIAHIFLMCVALAIAAFYSAMTGEEKRYLKGMGHTGKTVLRTEYQDW